MIRLQYKPTPRSGWRNSSLTMHPQGRENMEADARALAVQNGWAAWRIVPEGDAR